MNISLRTRTEETAAVYFEKTRDPDIQRVLPQRAKTVEEALADFRRTQEPGAASYGRTVWADGRYVGDVWCYGLHSGEEPDAMVSYCIFEKDLWGRGTASRSLGMFLEEITDKFGLRTAGAFTFAANAGSIKVLERNGFRREETFVEDGVESAYFLWRRDYGRIILETERLRLRELEEADLEAMGRFLKDPEVMYAYEHGFTDEEVRQWLDRNLQRYAEDGHGLWAVIEKETSDLIGLCGLTWQDWAGRRCSPSSGRIISPPSMWPCETACPCGARSSSTTTAWTCPIWCSGRDGNQKRSYPSFRIRRISNHDQRQHLFRRHGG